MRKIRHLRDLARACRAAERRALHSITESCQRRYARAARLSDTPEEPCHIRWDVAGCHVWSRPDQYTAESDICPAYDTPMTAPVVSFIVEQCQATFITRPCAAASHIFCHLFLLLLFLLLLPFLLYLLHHLPPVYATASSSPQQANNQTCVTCVRQLRQRHVSPRRAAPLCQRYCRQMRSKPSKAETQREPRWHRFSSSCRRFWRFADAECGEVRGSDEEHVSANSSRSCLAKISEATIRPKTVMGSFCIRTHMMA